jgi:D-alanyl-lipoteichoic acid acyltransferase DltB (MBOAT superfamily)
MLWHGAGWNFIFWGGLHGIYLIIAHAWKNIMGRCAKQELGVCFNTRKALLIWQVKVLLWKDASPPYNKSCVPVGNESDEA